MKRIFKLSHRHFTLLLITTSFTFLNLPGLAQNIPAWPMPPKCTSGYQTYTVCTSHDFCVGNWAQGRGFNGTAQLNADCGPVGGYLCTHYVQPPYGIACVLS